MDKLKAKPKELVYWEKQSDDKLCGLHALNAILQAPIHDIVSLSQVAIELTAAEKKMVASSNYISENVGLDGNFSIQVIIEALKRLGNIWIESIDSQENKGKNHCNEQCIVCNTDAHWITIRKVGGIWFNLNSCHPDGPQVISDFYLEAFLDSTREKGYFIFQVKGKLPTYDAKIYEEDLQPHQNYLTFKKVLDIHEYQQGLRDKPKDGEEDDQKGYKDFDGKGVSLGGGDLKATFAKISGQETDPELIQAMKLSYEDMFKDMPEKSDKTIDLRIRMPDGKNLTWRFNREDRILMIYNFCFYKQVENIGFTVSISYPKKMLDNTDLTLAEAGIVKPVALVCEKSN